MANTENLKTQVRLGVSPLSWTNDVLADLGGDVPLEVCLTDAAEIGYEGVELGRKFPDPKVLSPKLSDTGSNWPQGGIRDTSPGEPLEAEWTAEDHVRLLKGAAPRCSSTESAGKRPEIPLWTCL